VIIASWYSPCRKFTTCSSSRTTSSSSTATSASRASVFAAPVQPADEGTQIHSELTNKQIIQGRTEAWRPDLRREVRRKARQSAERPRERPLQSAVDVLLVPQLLLQLVYLESSARKKRQKTGYRERFRIGQIRGMW
jgi:hypothetical protein